MLENKWLTLYNKKVQDVKAEVLANILPGDVVHIGTDSQRTDRIQWYVTAICLLKPGKGGRAWYTKIPTPKAASLRQKLVQEAWNSVQTALELEPFLPAGCEITIHLDANPNVKFRSSDSVKELVGMVVGQGFKYYLKPEAWAANAVGDFIVKGKNQ